MAWTRKTALEHIEERGENVDDSFVIEMIEDILNDYEIGLTLQREHAIDVLEARTRALTPYDPNDPERS